MLITVYLQYQAKNSKLLLNMVANLVYNMIMETFLIWLLFCRGSLPSNPFPWESSVLCEIVVYARNREDLVIQKSLFYRVEKNILEVLSF